MPTYEYVCSECEHKFEKFQSIKAPSVRKCPECGKLKVRRLIGMGGGVIFKGNGFYQTDYRSESYKKGRDADNNSKKPADKKEKKSDGNKSETKEKSAKPA